MLSMHALLLLVRWMLSSPNRPPSIHCALYYYCSKAALSLHSCLLERAAQFKTTSSTDTEVSGGGGGGGGSITAFAVCDASQYALTGPAELDDIAEGLAGMVQCSAVQ